MSVAMSVRKSDEPIGRQAERWLHTLIHILTL